MGRYGREKDANEKISFPFPCCSDDLEIAQLPAGCRAQEYHSLNAPSTAWRALALKPRTHEVILLERVSCSKIEGVLPGIE